MATADLGKDPQAVSAMFDDVAKGYDITNAILSGGNAALWRIATVRAIDPQPGEKILDIAAGITHKCTRLTRVFHHTAHHFLLSRLAGHRHHPAFFVDSATLEDIGTSYATVTS